jgi:hypothetical protein
MISQGIGEAVKNASGDIKIGHRAMQGAASDARESERNEIEYEIDHKRFGFRLAEPLLVTAFGMIRALLPAGLEWDYLILHEMSHCILKTIILPGGWVYRCTFGNWSGPWTSLLDSFCNWIAMSSAIDQLRLADDAFDLWIYGDDTLLGFRNGSRPDGHGPADIQHYLARTFGIYAGETNLGNLSSYGDNPGATFLGCWNRDGLHGRPLGKWLDVSMLPEKPRPQIIDQWKRMRYLTHAAVATSDNEAYFTSYFMYVNQRLPAPCQTPPPGVGAGRARTVGPARGGFSSGSVDWREWEYGARTSLCQLKKKSRRYQRPWLWDRNLTGRTTNPPSAPRVLEWLQVSRGGIPIGLCGLQREEVTAIAAAPATAS